MRKDGLGDCIIFYPLLKYYREHFKDAELTLIFPTYFKSLLPLLQDMDQVIWFDHGEFSSSFTYRRTFLLNLKKRGYDVAIYPVYTREPIGDFMMKFTQAKEVIGFKNDGRTQSFYTRLISISPNLLNELERNEFFTHEITGNTVQVEFPSIDVTVLPQGEAGLLLNKHGLKDQSFAVIFPGAGASYRIWPSPRFAKVIEHILEKGIVPVICGSKGEKGLTEDILSHLPSQTKEKVVVLTGETDLPTLAHILSHALFYFGSDTGILHLSVAVGTPSMAIVGSGSIGRFFPYGNLLKNRAVYNPQIPSTGGIWQNTEILSRGGIHPSIEAVALKQAEDEIHSLIKFLYEKIH